MEYEIVCAQIFDANCGFRVHGRYFVEKKRFAPGVCPRCGNPVVVVEPGTNTGVIGKMVSLTTGAVTNSVAASA